MSDHHDRQSWSNEQGRHESRGAFAEVVRPEGAYGRQLRPDAGANPRGIACRHAADIRCIDTGTARFSSFDTESSKIVDTRANRGGRSSCAGRAGGGFSCVDACRACRKTSRDRRRGHAFPSHFGPRRSGRTSFDHVSKFCAARSGGSNAGSGLQRADHTVEANGNCRPNSKENGARGRHSGFSKRIRSSDATAQRHVVIESPARGSGWARPSSGASFGPRGVGHLGLDRHVGGSRLAPWARRPKAGPSSQDRRWEGGGRLGPASERDPRRSDQPAGG